MNLPYLISNITINKKEIYKSSIEKSNYINILPSYQSKMISDNLAVPCSNEKHKSQPLKESMFTLVSNKEVYKNVEVKLYEGYLFFTVKSEKQVIYKMTFDFDLIF